MSKSKYSYNGSKLHLQMDDSLADAYNRAVDAWNQAQTELKTKLGRDLETTDILNLQIRMTSTEHAAWNAVSDKINQLISEGLVLTEADCPSSYLIKL